MLFFSCFSFLCNSLLFDCYNMFRKGQLSIGQSVNSFGCLHSMSLATWSISAWVFKTRYVNEQNYRKRDNFHQSETKTILPKIPLFNLVHFTPVFNPDLRRRLRKALKHVLSVPIYVDVFRFRSIFGFQKPKTTPTPNRELL